MNTCEYIRVEIRVYNNKKKNLVWIFGYGVLHNGSQFNCASFKAFCARWKINLKFASVAHPESNGQVEAVNKIILDALKKNLDKKKGLWAEEIPSILWSYRTTHKAATGETPFRLAYGADAVIPLEVQMSSLRLENFDEDKNNEGLRLCAMLRDEVEDSTLARIVAQKQAISRRFNTKVKGRSFQVGDLVLRKAEFFTEKKREGKLGPNWEGPYRVTKILTPGTFKLEDMQGKELPHP